MTGPAPAVRWPRLVSGRGRFIADLAVRGMRDVAFVRSPFAHADIVSVDGTAARAVPGIDAVFTHDDLAPFVQPFRGTHALFEDLVAPEQTALAKSRVRHVGEPVALVIGPDRAVCEDAAELVEVDYAPRPAIAGPEAAIAEGAPAIHEAAPDNAALTMHAGTDAVDEAFAEADVVVEATFAFARHTGVPLEPRGLIAAFDPSDRSLTVHHSHQCPAAMQQAFATLLGLDAHRVTVICPDVGGAFGIKQQLYADELAVVAASVRLGQPLRFLADRLESMASDIQARHHIIKGRLGAARDGTLLAIDVDDILAIGPYSQYPRTSLGEGRAMLSCTAAPYRVGAVRARSRAVFTNLGMAGHYRGVGHPIATAVTEGLLDKAARALKTDPVALRQKNLWPQETGPNTTALGTTFEALPYGPCLDALNAAIPSQSLEAWRDSVRAEGLLAGFGHAVFVEMTSRGPAFYGDGRVDVSTRDGCFIRLEPSGAVRVSASVTEQGQGVETAVAQVVAHTLGVPLDAVAILTGDTAVTTHGGGTWASRSLAAGGHAAWQAATQLKTEIVQIAGVLLQAAPKTLDVKDGAVVDRADGRVRMALAELAATCHFRPHHLPDGRQPALEAVASFGPFDAPFRAGCGVQLCAVTIDPDTGIVRVVRHAVAHDCGVVANPLFVDGQLKGGIAQGLGAALTEQLLYDEDAQLLSGSLAEYKMPMAPEMPDIEIIHAGGDERMDEDAPPRFVGVGEAGTAGAPAAVQNAINDALAPRAAELFEMPATPERVLAALNRRASV
ncbi:MAG: xanthine dehydrogenase family protein molybdopterin-binding subunit [Pseudomonadota bacterium]